MKRFGKPRKLNGRTLFRYALAIGAPMLAGALLRGPDRLEYLLPILGFPVMSWVCIRLIAIDEHLEGWEEGACTTAQIYQENYPATRADTP